MEHVGWQEPVSTLCDCDLDIIAIGLIIEFAGDTKIAGILANRQ